MRFHAPDVIFVLAEASDRGVRLKWSPTGLDVTLSGGPIPADLMSSIRERSEEIRAVLSRAQVDYSQSPPLVIDPNTGADFPLTRAVWKSRDPITGWPTKARV